VDYDGLTGLHSGAQQGMLYFCRSRLWAGDSIDAQTQDGCTPLHLACMMEAIESNTDKKLYKGGIPGHADDAAEVVDLLLSRGADFNIRDSKGYTPMHYACTSRNVMAISHLLLAGASLYDDHYDHPIQFLSDETLVLVKQLEKEITAPPGTINTISNTSGTTRDVMVSVSDYDTVSFNEAIRLGYTDIIAKLLGCGNNHPNSFMQMQVNSARRSKRADVSTRSGSDHSVPVDSSRLKRSARVFEGSSLSLAIQCKRKNVAITMLTWLLEHGENILPEDIENYGATLMRWLIEEHKNDLLEYLISNGAEVSMQARFTRKKQSLMHIAIGSENFDAYFILKTRMLQRHPDISMPLNADDQTALESFTSLEVKRKFFLETTFGFSILSENNYDFWFDYVKLDLVGIEEKVRMYCECYTELTICKDTHGHLAEEVATFQNSKAIREAYLWYGRYRIMDVIPEHQSATCFVFRAWDDFDLDENCAPKRVAVKLMSNKTHWLRELNSRKQEFGSDCVIDVVARYPEDLSVDLDTQSYSETLIGKSGVSGVLSKKQAESMYAIIMPLADRNMFVAMKQERWVGNNLSVVRHIFTQIATDVRALHDCGILHADLKPLNLVRMDSNWLLIDLDACCRIGIDYTGFKSSSAIIPPEAVLVTDSDIIIRSPYNPVLTDSDQLVAHHSFDVWSLGCLLYQMVSKDSRPLFQGNIDDNLSTLDTDADNLHNLAKWEQSVKDYKLSLVKDPLARNLVSIMLEKDWRKRPTIRQILLHPFLSREKIARLPSEAAQFDVFISYRVHSDEAHAKLLYDRLVQLGLRVWWDKMELKSSLGESWEDGFCAGLSNSRTVICVISRDAISSWSTLASDSSCDNLLLEFRLAIELKELRYLHAIFPVFIGDFDSTTQVYSNFFASGGLPKLSSETSVQAVEQKVVYYMASQALGVPVKSPLSVKSTLDEINRLQGGLVSGNAANAFDECIKDIHSKILSLSLS